MKELYLYLLKKQVIFPIVFFYKNNNIDIKDLYNKNIKNGYTKSIIIFSRKITTLLLR